VLFDQLSCAGLPVCHLIAPALFIEPCVVEKNTVIGLWGLPEHIVDIVHYHHLPAQCEQEHFFALAAVHIADVLAHEPEYTETGHGVFLDDAWLDQQGWRNQMADWQACAREVIEQHG